VIDPWPSNQLIKPEVVSIDEYLFGDKETEIELDFSNQSVRIDHIKLKSFDHIQMSDFNLLKL
jgi:hypothetical protein